MGDFIDNLSKSEHHTPSQKKISNYFLYNLDKIAFGTVEELSQAIHVSTTTVIRFSQHLGYSGFSEMQKEARQTLLKKSTVFPDDKETMEDLSELHLAFQTEISSITSTLKILKKDDLEQAVKLLAESKHIYLLGMRKSYALAYYTYISWGQLRKNVHIIHSVGMDYPEEVINARPGAVCVAFNFPRYSRPTQMIMSYLKEHGVKTILVTSPSATANTTELANVVLPCVVYSFTYQNSHVAPICLINYITQQLAITCGKDSSKIFADIDELLGSDFYLGSWPVRLDDERDN